MRQVFEKLRKKEIYQHSLGRPADGYFAGTLLTPPELWQRDYQVEVTAVFYEAEPGRALEQVSPVDLIRQVDGFIVRPPAMPGEYWGVLTLRGQTKRSLSFSDLREANLRRLPEFKNRKGGPAHVKADGSDWTILEWAGAVAGEIGEAANIAKKMRRGDFANEAELSIARRDLGEEIADALIYLDILAHQAGLDLARCVVNKFNATSARIRSSVKLELKEE